MMINNRTGIKITCESRPKPWFVNEGIGHIFQFRNKAANKVTFRILVPTLFDRIINAHGIHAGCTRLHLYL